MKGLIFNELGLCLKKRNLYLFFMIQLVIILSIVNVYNNSKEGIIEVTRIDGFLGVCGGSNRIFLLGPYVQWILKVSIIFIICEDVMGFKEGFDTMMLTRVESKIKWWLGKVITIFIIVLSYSILICIEGDILSMIVLGKANYISQYTRCYYPNILNFNNSFLMLKFTVFIILTTGVFAVVTLVNSIGILFNSNRSHLFIMIFLLILEVAYNSKLISRMFSPISFASTLDLNGGLKEYVSQIMFNIFISFISILTSIFLLLKKDLK
ncbi:hypothetical protein [Hathewaya limosa]|uniref:ABC transporter permease n=1 Tax=Hathewaya limosa TaxID=1536 RepID=A0ABU0JR83_HATLI|nr:hypothetical protein [Hathewaya limosa]MDQ0478688.1 hypothetical protein [Hathewaya limosa]